MIGTLRRDEIREQERVSGHKLLKRVLGIVPPAGRVDVEHHRDDFRPLEAHRGQKILALIHRAASNHNRLAGHRFTQMNTDFPICI